MTLAWSLANRYGYVACHGGMKRYNLKNGESFTIGVFGLSGSGKSTLTHEKHNGRYNISILHDDAYIINTNDLSSVAMEPTYFDKMQDYPVEHPANKYLLTLQNVGVTLDEMVIRSYWLRTCATIMAVLLNPNSGQTIA